MQKHGGERPPDPANSNRPPGDKTTFWLLLRFARELLLLVPANQRCGHLLPG